MLSTAKCGLSAIISIFELTVSLFHCIDYYLLLIGLYQHIAIKYLFAYTKHFHTIILDENENTIFEVPHFIAMLMKEADFTVNMNPM